MQRVTRLTAPARGARSMPHARLLSMSASRSQQDKKDDLMDKDSINTTSTEYSKSGGGDAGAAQTDHAFDPSSTSPEGQTSSEQVSLILLSPVQPVADAMLRAARPRMVTKAP